MARARGANALLAAKFESTYGTPPAGNWLQLPFVQSNLGEEQALLEDDLLGTGRETLDPELDVANNNGDITVPVDVRAFGNWLKLMFGAPTTDAEDAATGTLTFSAQPAVDTTVTINGTAFTFKASGATGNQVNIGVSTAATVTALATALNASVVSGVAEATYLGAGSVLNVTHDTEGHGGNAFTLAAAAGSNATASGATLTGGTNSHTFTSGASSLPSLSAEIGMPDVPSYGVNFGIRGNTLQIGMSRRGKLSAKIGLIAQGEDIDDTTSAGTPTDYDITRFAQATGSITKDGVELASVVEAEVNYSNNLDPVETIRPDGRIEDADPAKATGNGNVKMRFANHTMLDAATGRDPVALTFGWAFEQYSLVFTYERVFLPKVKRPIEGPGGILATFPWQGSGASGHVLTVVLINDVASY